MPEKVRPQATAEEADCEDLESDVRTELGRFALAARREYLAAGGRLLDWDDLERELKERRGGTNLLDEQ